MKKILLILLLAFMSTCLFSVTVMTTPPFEIIKARLKNEAVISKILLDTLGEEKYAEIISNPKFDVEPLSGGPVRYVSIRMYFKNHKICADVNGYDSVLKERCDREDISRMILQKLSESSDTIYLRLFPLPYNWGEDHKYAPLTEENGHGYMAMEGLTPMPEPGYLTARHLIVDSTFSIDNDFRWFRAKLDSIISMPIITVEEYPIHQTP